MLFLHQRFVVGLKSHYSIVEKVFTLIDYAKRATSQHSLYTIVLLKVGEDA
jgi:hypothetical protein